MENVTKQAKSFPPFLFLLLSCLVLYSVGCKKQVDQPALREFRQVNLVANNSEYDNPLVDPTLLNAWGLAFSPNGIAWVNSQAGHVSELYDKEGNIIRPPVNIPGPGGPATGNPTGIVFNSAPDAGDFVLPNKQRAVFLFVGVDGILSGWNQAAGSDALVIKDN